MKGLEVLFEDNHLLVVNKPAGVLSQGDSTRDYTILDVGRQYLKEKYNKPGEVFLGCVHRLDRPVSGVIIMARTSKALTRLNQQFKLQEVEKTYWALVNQMPDPPQGEIKHYLSKDSQKNITSAYTTDKPGRKEAILKYRLVKKWDRDYLLEVKPLTGRPHQIRVQLATIGCAIKGDLKYGSKFTLADGNISLHAYRIKFLHPVKKEMMTIVSKIPSSWGNLK